MTTVRAPDGLFLFSFLNLRLPLSSTASRLGPTQLMESAHFQLLQKNKEAVNRGFTCGS